MCYGCGLENHTELCLSMEPTAGIVITLLQSRLAQLPMNSSPVHPSTPERI